MSAVQFRPWPFALKRVMRLPYVSTRIGEQSNPTQVGQRALTAVLDNGTSAKDPLDQLSFSFFGNGFLGFVFGTVDCTELTADDDFANSPFGSLLSDLTHGQVKVR